MKRDTIDSQVLEYAMENEKVAQKVYKILTTRTEDKKLKEMFIEFSREEGEHYKILACIADESDDQIFFSPPPDEELVMREIIDLPEDSEWTFNQVMEYAIQREIESYGLYKELAKISHSKKNKETFLWLAEAEKKHEEKFRKMCETIENA